MPECKVKKNKAACNCAEESCGRKGICCECMRYHRGLSQFPACFFPDDVAAAGERSVEAFIGIYNKKGKWR